MKRFQFVKEALDYCVYCPICAKLLEINDPNVNVKTQWRSSHSITTLTWRYDTNDDLVININTNRIEVINRYVEKIPIITGDSAGHFTVKSAYDVQTYERLSIECTSCCQYSYVVRMEVNVGWRRVTDIFIETETVTLDDDKRNTHQIENVYPSRKTIYTKYSASKENPNTGYKSDGIVVLPLIPIDLKNPEKTIERAKMLNLFS